MVKLSEWMVEDNVRDGRYDTLKFALIVFVVLGHVLESNLSNGLCRFTYRLIYTLHMPVFVFLSGFFYKDKPSKVFWKSVLNLLLVYLIFQVLYFGDPKAYWNHPEMALTIDGLKYNIIHLYIPSGPLWFLVSLACWRIMARLIGKIGLKNRRLPMLFLSILIAFAVGFIPVDKSFSFQRTFVFFPYFWGGVVAKSFRCSRYDRSFLDVVKNCSWIWCIVGFLFLVLIARFGKYVPTEVLYGSESYHGARFPSYVMAAERLMMYLLVMPITILIVAKMKPLKWFTEGGKWTMFYFLYHTYFIWLVQWSSVNLNIPQNLWLAFAYTVIIIAVLYVLHKIKFLSKITNPIKQ